MAVCRGNFSLVEQWSILWDRIVHSGCSLQFPFLFLGSRDIWPLPSNGILLLGVSLWWLSKVSQRKHLFIGWLCVWCMVCPKWVSPRTPPCYWVVSRAVCETQWCVGLTVNVWFWLCVSLLFPSALWNHAQLEGGSDAERLMSTLAYGWVEHCNDIASSGLASSI